MHALENIHSNDKILYDMFKVKFARSIMFGKYVAAWNTDIFNQQNWSLSFHNFKS